MADQATRVSLENHTEHVLHITLPGGGIVTVPPQEQGAQTVTFNTSEERERFEQALQTDTVRGWIRDKHLVVNGLGPVDPSQQQGGHDQSGQQPTQPQNPSPATPVQPTSPNTQSPNDTQPEVSRTSRSRGGRE